jgi:capsular exopolysaccharide synthesis family protein
MTTRPAAPFVEAYRALRTVVLYAAGSGVAIAALNPGPSANGNGQENGQGSGAAPQAPTEPEAQVVLITSPSAGEGKTTTAAHLAAVLAEFGKRTLVVSADFRRPRVHELFDVEREPGLSDVLESGTGKIHLSDLQMTTNCLGVSLLPSGSPVHNPAHLLTQTRALIAAARKLFDFVIVDTPPLLVANDATELAAVADMVLLKAKADRTSRDGAMGATEMLRRVHAPLVGVVVVAAHDTPTAYGYYRYRYYAEADQGGSRASARRARKAAKKAAKQPVTAGTTPTAES